MAFAVQFPRFVQVENFRLVLLHWLISAAILAWVIAQFATNKSYLEKRSPQGSVQFWASGWFDHELGKESNEIDAQKEHCSNPSKYHYCYDTACGWDYRDFQCMRLCAGDVRDDCLHDSERWVKEDGGMFFPTYFNETFVKRTSLTESVETSRQWFVVGVESLRLTFDHEYFVEKASGGSERGKSSEAEGSTYKEGITTILRDKDKNEIQTWEPGESVSLSIKTMLDVGGIDLDAVNHGLGPNYKEGAEIGNGMLTRICGGEIGLWMSYVNPEQHGRKYEGPICYLDIAASAVWTSKPALQILDHLGSTRLRYKQGLRIRFFTAGTFGFVSTEACIAGLTSLIVFLGLGKRAVMYFAFHGLGNLSKIYKHVIVNRVNLVRECCGAVTRLLSSSTGFLEVEDTTEGISRARLHERLVWLFRNSPELDEAEVNQLAKVVFDGLVAEDKLAIGLQEFAIASSSNEHVTFKSLVHIFDKDRPKKFLEKVFSDHTTILGSEYLQNHRQNTATKHSNSVPDAESLPEGLMCKAHGGMDLLEQRCASLENLCKDMMIRMEALKKDNNELRETIALSLQAQSSEQTAAKEFRSAFSQLQADQEQFKAREKEVVAKLSKHSDQLSVLAAVQSQMRVTPNSAWCTAPDVDTAKQRINPIQANQ